MAQCHGRNRWSDNDFSLAPRKADSRGRRHFEQDRFGTLRVVSSEGLIGFKLQGLVNDPRRTQDLEDIRALIRANRATVNIDKLREYFRLFNRESLLDELLNEID